MGVGIGSVVAFGLFPLNNIRCAAGEQFAVEDAARDGDRRVCTANVFTDEAAMRAVARRVAVDGDAAAAIGDADCAVLCTRNAGGIFVRGVDVARYVQVLNHAAVLDVAEGRDVVLDNGAFGRAVAHGQRVALSIEGAGKVFIAGTSHSGDFDVGIQFTVFPLYDVPS